jgi:hypothetical protein
MSSQIPSIVITVPKSNVEESAASAAPPTTPPTMSEDELDVIVADLSRIVWHAHAIFSEGSRATPADLHNIGLYLSNAKSEVDTHLRLNLNDDQRPTLVTFRDTIEDLQTSNVAGRTTSTRSSRAKEATQRAGDSRRRGR